MIIYYTKSGHCEAIAKNISNITKMEVMHLEDQNEPNIISGAVKAFFKKESKLKEMPKFSASDRIIVVAPVWADVFPPAINTILPELKNHPNVTYIASCTSKDGNEKHSPKIKKVLPNAKTLALYENLSMEEKMKLISEIL